MEKPITEGQIRKFERILADKGVSSALFQRLLTCGILADALDTKARLTDRRAWRTVLELTVEERIFKYVIPAGTSIEELFCDGGYERRSMGDALGKIIQKSTVTLEFKRFRFNRYMHRDAAISEIRNSDPHNPWREADIFHLLFFGNQRLGGRLYVAKEYLETSCTVALGSTFEGHRNRFSPRIFWDGRYHSRFSCGTRVLAVENIRSLSPWSTFLAVREVR